MDTSPGLTLANTANIIGTARFSFLEVLGDAMNKLATRATLNQISNGGVTLRGFAFGQANTTDFRTLYNLVQCTPDLSESDCNLCLRRAIGQLPNCCTGRLGGRVLYPSCNVRYEVYQFYRIIVSDEPSPPSPTLTYLTNPGVSKRISSQVIFAIVFGVISFLFLCALAFYFLRSSTKHDALLVETDGDDISKAESLQYDLSTVWVATNRFSSESKVGEGGFGEVFKGTLPNGQTIAVKRLSRTSGQGALEFKNEVEVVAKLHHRNLVSLVGYCLEREEKILIYEFVHNKSLDYFLFDPEKKQALDWSIRFKVIKGITQGILYLHEHSRLRIIHRDLKASNVLLDEDMNPKISDFGMARIFGVNQSQANTSRIVGTFGYMAPEYIMHGEFSFKSDVFSFGVLLLEICSGRKTNSFYHSEGSENLLSHAWKHWRDGTNMDLVDPTLGDTVVKHEVIQCINIGLLCVQEYAIERPSMASVAHMLDSYSSVTLPLPHQPAFFPGSRTEALLMDSNDESVPWSRNEVSITQLYPR